MDLDRLRHIAQKYLEGKASAEEEQALHDYYNNVSGEETETVITGTAKTNENAGAEILAAVREKMQEKAPAIILPFTEEQKPARRSWKRWAAAAAILLFLVTGSYFLFFNKTEQQIAVGPKKPLMPDDIAPGSNKAILRLADNSTIVLDDASDGLVADEGGAAVRKISDGRIVYDNAGEKGTEVTYHTVSTPRGGQYNVKLPDGTQVWLNAASSIRFPTVFVGSQRRVEVTGEVYMEVAKDASHPFIVSVNQAEVEVLGTHFNIMAYANEPSLQTTLLEGAVRMSNDRGKTVLLQPGQQAAITADGNLSSPAGVDVDLAIAWKNGMTAFKSADMRTIMRQVERWYDVDISFEGEVSQRRFTGGIPRDVNLSELLKLFGASKIKFTIDGTNKKLKIQS